MSNNNPYLNIKRNCIFDNGDGWKILKFEGFKTVGPIHACAKVNTEYLTGGLSTPERCRYCRELVPDNVQALVLLHNWDKDEAV